MRRLVAVLCVAVLIACDLAPPEEVTAPDPQTGVDGPAASELPAAEPEPPTIAAFAAEAEFACVTARAILDANPLRRDPVAAGAKRRDLRAAAQHYSGAARAWNQAASHLFEFGLPDDARAQRLIAALDVLSMRSRQAAEALAGQEREAQQAALGAADQALREADAAARELGLGPLARCGTVVPPLAGRRRVSVTAVDFAFRVAGVRAGATRFVLRNRGSEDHQLFVVPLRRPGTLKAAIAADREGDPVRRYLAGRGDTSPLVEPGGRVVLDVELEPGPYGLVCFVASEDGTPHAYKGMATEVTVQP